MTYRNRIAALITLSVVVASARVGQCVTLNQVDLFQGSKDNWTDGHGGVNGTLVTTGGPNGAGDSYLQVSSGTFDSEPRLVTFNEAQWTGNYIAAGVNAISMSLKNFGASTLPIRITIRDAAGGQTVGGYSSKNPFMLPADGQWHTAQFLLDAADMTPVGFSGLPPLATELTAVQDFRLVSAGQPSIIGDAINARIGVDDIRAGSVPEPTAYSLLIIGGAVLIAFRAVQCPFPVPYQITCRRLGSFGIADVDGMAGHV
jgi:hypothetical protein